jgi:hypothetical protein
VRPFPPFEVASLRGLPYTQSMSQSPRPILLRTLSLIALVALPIQGAPAAELRGLWVDAFGPGLPSVLSP